MNILVVDDDAVMVEVLQYFLEEVGMSVTVANSPPEALQFLQQKDIDLVVSDLVMPEGGAPRLLAHIEKNRPGLPVIVMSGYGADDVSIPRERTRGFWRKGEGIDNLIALVKAVH